MMMKKSIFFLFIYFPIICFQNQVQAQEDSLENEFSKSQFFIGLNTTKSLFHFSKSNGSYSIDPEFRIRITTKGLFNMGFGFNTYNSQEDISNLSAYKNEGFYVKVGFDFANKLSDFQASKSAFLVGFNVFYAQFGETGTFTIKEKVFGDYVEHFERANLSTGGIDFNLSSWIPVSTKFVFVIGGRLSFYGNIDLSNQPYPQFPIYYFPNVGINILPKQNQGGSGIGGGFDLKLLCRIF
jgi:hypothetical protein